jgi:glycosyltransferase involved in cell wall biosynthesis
MRLLILTQAVDLDDPLLAFFHRWIAEFGHQCAHVDVICLKEGRHRLPPNIDVYSLGKEKRSPRTTLLDRIIYAARFYRLIWKLRNQYDDVFVHMNEEYVLLGGLLWRLWGKRIGFERIHPYGTWRSSLAYKLSDCVFYLSEQAHSYRAAKRRPSPHGIDADAYAAVPRSAPADSLLFLGRIDPVKRLEVILEAVRILAKEGVPLAPLDIYGDPSLSSEDYAARVRHEFADLERDGRIAYQGRVLHEDTPAIYARHAFFINITPSGSLDKTILEAMASGCLVITSNKAMRGVVSPKLFVEEGGAEELAKVLRDAVNMTPDERAAESAALKGYVRDNHTVQQLVKTYLAEIAAC